jgi:hypothetical protein
MVILAMFNADLIGNIKRRYHWQQEDRLLAVFAILGGLKVFWLIICFFPGFMPID